MDADGSNPQVVSDGPAAFPKNRALRLTPKALATRFEPVLRFDTSEAWRPLNVESFLGEGAHRLCGVGPSCAFVNSTQDISAVRSANAYIDQPQSFPTGAGKPTYYATPNLACRVDGLSDCDSGAASSLYYGVASPSPTSQYRFIDYWAYYRVNYSGGVSPLAPYFHEGDWEGVTVAPSPDASTFDYAAFSQHGKWYAYLRDVLRCENNPGDPSTPADAGTCTGPDATRIDVMVANGTHANYTTPCSETFAYLSCRSNQGASVQLGRERGYDGKRRWGRAYDSDALLPLPISNGLTWTNWPGMWGTRYSSYEWPRVSGPRSPGIQTIQIECALVDNDEDACPDPPEHGNTLGIGWRANAPAGGGYRSAGSVGSVCRSWVGDGVGAALCSPAVLRRAVRRAHVGPGSTTNHLAVAGRRAQAIQGAGIVQLAARRPLVDGDRIAITRPQTTGTKLFLRIADKARKRILVARFPVPPATRRPRGTGTEQTTATLHLTRGSRIRLGRNSADSVRIVKSR